MKNKIFTRIIITTLLCAFLTLNVGKVTRVSAVGTTIAASAAAALCAVGIVYCSYMALSGASVHVPDSVESIESWLQDMGTKVVQYPSGRAAYEEIYPQMLSLNPATTLLHDFVDSEVWTWTYDKIKQWVNDFSSTDVIENIATYTYEQDVSQIPTNGFAYTFEFVNVPQVVTNDGNKPFSVYGYTFTPLSGEKIIYPGNTVGKATVAYTNLEGTLRNYYNGTGYFVQQYVNGVWQVYSPNVNTGYKTNSSGSYYRYFSNNVYLTGYQIGSSNYSIPLNTNYPVLANEPIYDETTDSYRPMVIPNSLVTVKNPQWPTLPPDDDKKPVVPYVQYPLDPTWVDPVTGIHGGGNWGFDLGRLLDTLEDLAGLMMEIGAIGELINEFKNLVGGNYYIYYNDGDDNYYNYYTITNFGDNIYSYDIDVSEVDEHLPVDLNTIQKYSSNRYLEQIKQSAINGSSIVRDFAVFWYDVDPEVTYIALGICVLILLGAFTGKLGHS